MAEQRGHILPKSFAQKSGILYIVEDPLLIFEAQQGNGGHTSPETSRDLELSWADFKNLRRKSSLYRHQQKSKSNNYFQIYC